MDKYDNIKLPGFSVYSSCRAKCKRASGGIMILMKDYLNVYVSTIQNTKCKDAIWIAINEKNLNFKIAIGCVYIPPENSV